MNPIRIGIVGIGKIAVDQHLPALEADSNFDLVAGASRHARPAGLRVYPDLAAMLEAAPEIEAVSLCTPPLGRYDIARLALESGRHVMLEKPPGATVAEVEQLAAMAASRGLTLYTSWHSRAAAAVAPAKAWLSGRAIRSASIRWKEDVRRWHPGQAWIWEPGGLGVFDPGINALSILTEIMGRPLRLDEATLDFPENRAAPIAAELAFLTDAGARVQVEFDWRQTGPQTWDIEIDTDDGRLLLGEGGGQLTLDGSLLVVGEEDALVGEYPRLYRRFASLVRAGGSDVDLAPFKHVADAFMLGRRRVVEAFED